MGTFSPDVHQTLYDLWLNVELLYWVLKRLRDRQPPLRAAGFFFFFIFREAARTDFFFCIYFFHQRVLRPDCYKKKAQCAFYFFVLFFFYKFLKLILLMWNFLMQQFLSKCIWHWDLFHIDTLMLQTFSRIICFFFKWYTLCANDFGRGCYITR